MLFLLVLEAKRNGSITILFNSLDLSNNTGTSFDTSSWHILAISTENGCHSDFLS